MLLEMIPIIALVVIAIIVFMIASANQATKALNEIRAKEDEERQARIELLRAQTEALKIDR